MGSVELHSDTACQVHETISGKSTRLGELLENRFASGTGAVGWLAPVTPATVHRIEGLFLLASEQGIPMQFQMAGEMSDREQAFLDDFLNHRFHEAAPLRRRLLRSILDSGTILRDCFRAAWQFRPVAGRRAAIPEAVPTALLIGAYGGEHVGDAAILGGVLLRLHKEFGTRQAHVFSHRPQHTARLVQGLSTPVKLSVHPYEIDLVVQWLAKSDALILAGGPLMDLPKVLVKHLGATGAAIRLKRPVVAMSVGIGPFKRRISRWMARRIVQRTGFISVRASEAAADPILAGIPVQTTRDPAFDYLASRGQLSLLSEGERKGVELLLQGTEGRLRVGVNLRPIRHLWSRKGPSYSRKVEEIFFERFCEGLVRFARLKEVSYIFFPMNPIQLGCSDLTSAYRLHRLMGGKADMRVWEADPDIDGVLHLLRQLHCAVTMRLHAGIFSISQDLPVLGIDYYPGQGGKVEHLFQDLGRARDVCRMDAIDPDWVVSGLLRLTENI